MFGYISEAQRQSECEKRRALRTVIVDQLERKYKDEVEEIENSEEFVNFEDDLVATDDKAARLKDQLETLEDALNQIRDDISFEDDRNVLDFIIDCRDYNPIRSAYEGYVHRKKVEAFPKAFTSFNSWKMGDLVDSYLRIYDDLKNSDKIAATVVERLG